MHSLELRQIHSLILDGQSGGPKQSKNIYGICGDDIQNTETDWKIIVWNGKKCHDQELSI